MDRFLTALFVALALAPRSTAAEPPRPDCNRLLIDPAGAEEDGDSGCDADRAHRVRAREDVAWNLWSDGREALNAEQYDTAVQLFGAALALPSVSDPEASALLSARANAFVLMENQERALADLDAALDLDPENGDALYRRGTIRYWSLDDAAAAIPDFDAAIRLDPTATHLYVTRARAYRTLERPEAALADLDAAIELEPEGLYVLYRRGILYRDLGRDRPAVRDFGRAIGLQPLYSRAYVERGLAQARLGRRELAIADLEKAAVLAPRNRRIGRLLGDLLSGSPAEAITLAHRAVAAEDERDYERAIALSSQALEVTGLSGETRGRLLYSRGWLRGKLDRHEAANADYTAALDHDSRTSRILLDRGRSRHELSDYDGAIEDYTAALELDPDYALAYNNRCIALRRKGLHQQAVEDCTRAIDLEMRPDLHRAYHSRALAYREMGRFDQAIADHAQTILLKPDYSYAYSSRGWIHSQIGRYDEAIWDYSQAIRLGSRDAKVYSGRGWAYARKKQYDQAITDYDTALEIDPFRASTYTNRCFAHTRSGRHEAAVEDCTRSIALGGGADDRWPYSSRAGALYKLERYDEAIADYSAALELDPEYHHGYHWRGRAYEAQGYPDLARQDYAAALALKPGRLRYWFARYKHIDGILLVLVVSILFGAQIVAGAGRRRRLRLSEAQAAV